MKRRALLQSLFTLPLVKLVAPSPPHNEHEKRRLEWAHQSNFDYWKWMKLIDKSEAR
jgi:hypothetical protein